MANYRMDVRTEEQFKKDIEDGHSKERAIINMYAEHCMRITGKPVVITDNGIDNSGEFIRDTRNVNTKADYLINGNPVEVKFNNQMLDIFHLKVSQARSYIDQGASILWVNGYETGNPVFTFIPSGMVKMLAKKSEVVQFKTWGGKDAYRINSNVFRWREF